MSRRCTPCLALASAVFLFGSVAAVDYVDSSSGLETPQLDGGDTEVEMADVDGDGHPDLVSVGDHGNPLINSPQEGILVWLGDGQGNWTHVRFGHLGYGGIAVGDVNGDGLADVAYGIHHDYGTTDLGDQLLEVALGDGTGAFWTPWDDGLAEDGQSWGMFAADLGDVDGDGDLDVGSTGFGASDGFQVYLNRGDGSWSRSMGFLGGNSSHVFEFGDVDGDGRLDVATAKQEGTVWLGDGEGFFTVADGNLPSPGTFGVREGPSLGDVDGDGRDDLAYCDGNGNARVWLYDGSTSWLDVSAGVPATGTCGRTQLRDMDGDGTIDLVTFGSRDLRVFAGDGSGQTWAESARLTVPEVPGSVSAFRVGRDVDHNGLPDIVVVSDQRVDLFNTRNVLRLYRETSVPSSLDVRLVRPGTARTLLAGSVAFVEWDTEVPIGSVAGIDLELSTTGESGPWETIAASIPDNGRFQWRVPATVSTDCRIRVTATTTGGTASSTGPGPFAIERRPDPVSLHVPSRDSVEWTDTLSRDRYNLYRSDLEQFIATGRYTQDPAEVPAAARFCDRTGTTLADSYEPAPGDTVFYLATGYRIRDDGISPDAAMAEGTLGQASDATTRGNASPCPR